MLSSGLRFPEGTDSEEFSRASDLQHNQLLGFKQVNYSLTRCTQTEVLKTRGRTTSAPQNLFAVRVEI